MGSGKNKKKNRTSAKKQAMTAAGAVDSATVHTASDSEEYMIDPKYIGTICYNCGLPGHFVGMCSVPKICFICKTPGHHMDICPKWYEPYPAAQYWGSANSGLGFFHIEAGDKCDSSWLNFGNVGLVVVEEGNITAEELESCFIGMWKTNWPW